MLNEGERLYTPVITVSPRHNILPSELSRPILTRVYLYNIMSPDLRYLLCSHYRLQKSQPLILKYDRAYQYWIMGERVEIEEVVGMIFLVASGKPAMKNLTLFGKT